MGEVAVLGLGMHPWGKFPEKPLNDICRVAVEAALADADIRWRDIEAVAAASSAAASSAPASEVCMIA